MWLYLSLMMILAFTSLQNKNSKKQCALFLCVFTIIMGFKSINVGNDTPSYVELYNRLHNMSSFTDPSSRFEVGYQIYNKIIGMIWDDYQALFLITAIICIGCIGYGIMNLSQNWQYSLFLFIGLRFYYFFLSGIRQSMAVSIIIVAYVFLKRRKNILFIMLVLLAMTFHFSAVIFFFALPLSYMKFDSKSIIKVLFGVIVVYVFFGPLLSLVLSHLPSYYSHYMLTEASSANNLSDFIHAIIPCLFLLLAYILNYNSVIDESHIPNQNQTRELLVYHRDGEVQLLFLLVAAGLSLVSTRASIIDRMVQYYWIFSIISVSNMISSIKNQRNRVEWLLLITFCVIVYNVALLLLRPEWNAIVPYEFFWSDR